MHDIVLQLTTEPGYIYPEALKLIMLLADLMNGFIYEIGNLAQTDARTVGHVAFILPGIFYLVFGLLYICICPCIVCEERMTGCIVKYAISISSLIGLTLYLIGDNYYLVEQINEDKFITTLNNATLKVEILNRINAIQPSFLLLSIMFHRAIPQILMVFIRKFEKDQDNINDSFFIGMMNTLVLTTELDSWFTMVQSTNDCSSQLKWVWTMWMLMIAVYTVLLLTNSIFGLHTSENYHDKDPNCQSCCGTCMIAFIVIAFALYLLGDNRQPLDCYPSLSARGRSGLKFFFIFVAAVIYVTVIIVHGFGFHLERDIFREDKNKSCCCERNERTD